MLCTWVCCLQSTSKSVPAAFNRLRRFIEKPILFALCLLRYRCDYELLLFPTSVFITPPSQYERAADLLHGDSPSAGVFLLAFKWLNVPTYKSAYQVAGSKGKKIVRVSK